jgi:two-component system, chemotaxis family, protein-glutamate methylesterase/glutaminase
LVREQSDELERALWAAVRALEESAALSHRLYSNGESSMKGRFAEREKTQAQQAELIRNMLLHGTTLSRNDAPK